MSSATIKIQHAVLDFLEILMIATFVFVLVYLFVGKMLEVDGGSMEPNYHNGEQIIAEKISIQFKDLKRGEIVIFRHPDRPQTMLIKRLVGLPGETIKVFDGHIYINDELLEEPYIPVGTKTPAGEALKENVTYKISDGSYVFLGDNREESTDSRRWGAVPKDLIVGRGILVYYPFSAFRIMR